MQAPDSWIPVLERHDTGSVSDALDTLGINGGLEGLCRRSGRSVVVGPAYTVLMEPIEPGNVGPAADYIDDAPPGSIVVIANAGRRNCTVFGDILAETAQLRGIRGTVIDGCNRDLDRIRELDYPLWSVGTYMKSGKNRVRMAGTGVPVVVAGVTVSPGDLVVADGSGVVVVPSAHIGDVAARTQDIAAMENRVRDDVDRGMPLRQARRLHGYNQVTPTLVDG
jgi:regulator of RNase E activity RraA